MSVISGITTAVMGSNATSDAAKTSANAQNNATDVADKNYQQTRSDFMPYYNVGKEAIPAYQKMLNGTYDMKESPSAQYQLTQGTKSMNRALAARGLSGSGNAANRITELNQSVAASDWKDQYSRILDALKLGTGASASMGSASNANTAVNQQGATNLGNIATNEGNNQASLYAGMGGQTSNAAALGLKAYKAYSAAAVPAAEEYTGMGSLAYEAPAAEEGILALSSRDYKENISELTNSERDEILRSIEKIPLYNWQYKDQYKDQKDKHIGLVVEEAPEFLVTNDGKHMDVINYLGVLTAAVQVLLAERSIKEK